MIAFIVIMGIKPMDELFGDYGAYYSYFKTMKAGYDFKSNDADWAFYNFMRFSSKTMDPWVYFTILSAIYVLPLYVICKKKVPNNATIMLLYGMSAFSFWTYCVNGIRNGVACSLVLLALSFLKEGIKQKILCASICIIAIGCHKSVALPVIAMFFSYVYRKPHTMFYFWVASIFISLMAGDTLGNFFASIGFDDRLSSYVNSNKADMINNFSQVGFRWDFLLYSSMPILLGWYLIFKRDIYDKTYLLLLGTYIYSNAFWVMIIRAAFSNRFAYLSWFVYPIVLAYPLLKFDIWPNQGKRVGQILFAHFGFTFVMWLIG
jgi:hypothetical protein